MLKACLFCEKEYTPFPHTVGHQKFCSPVCRYKNNFQKHHDYYKNYWLTRPNLFEWKGIRKCKYCSKEFEAKVANQNYCSEGHRKYAWKKAHWEVVKKKENERSRKSHALNPEKWRQKVRNYKAQKKANGGNFSLLEWNEMKEFYNFTCPDCNRKEPEIKLTIDHIIPLSKGGKHLKENIQALCFSCNSGKRDRLLKA